MLQARVGANAEEVRQASAHTLFVEGERDESFDPAMLRILLQRTRVSVQPLGRSASVRTVADALHRFHPTYYFLVDRDHHDDAYVEKSWRGFPDVSSANLLVWRKRELESYFIEPNYFMRNQFVSCAMDELVSILQEIAARRIYFEAANTVLLSVIHALKSFRIDPFAGVEGFVSRDAAVTKILERKEFRSWRRSMSQRSGDRYLINLYDRVLAMLLEGEAPPRYGNGRWLELLPAKRILSEVVDRCCDVRDRDNCRVQGRDAIKKVVEDLLRLPLTDQPPDFQELYRLVQSKVVGDE
jgi:hypothetical protein